MKLSSGICCCRGAVLTGLTCQFSKNPEEDEQTKERAVCVWSWGGGRLRDYNDYSCFCGRTKKKKPEKKPTGCYTGLAFMKKDFDVNDCESPPPPLHPPPIHPPLPEKKNARKKKIETSTELSKWQIQKMLPFHPVFFLNERRIRGGVKGRSILFVHKGKK